MADRFKNVAVLMGGPSAERAVSLRSGTAVARGLRAAGYTVTEVDPRDGQLRLDAEVEAAFVALHGAFGEDGAVQALLRQRALPYTGAGEEASRTAFDKQLSKLVFVRHGIPTPDYEVLRPGAARTLPLPVVVKPVQQGSSIGLHRVVQEADWAPALTDALRYGGRALVERYIEGRELTVGLVGEDVLPVVEICAPGGQYDYKAKYTPGLTEY
ncbi:MAG: D-alanine--D-alanine ligase, partial [Kiritimatiellaeota bacterium]|nr:D-alanine--D-alanine ligase [Kiritimatiellota bacterium]